MTWIARRGDRKQIMDIALAVVMAVAALVEATQPGRGYSHPAVMVPAALLVTVPLAWRRRAPFAVLLVVGTVGTIEAMLVTVPASAIQFVASLIAIYTVASLCRRRVQLYAIPVVLVAATVTMIRDPATHSVVEALPTYGIIVAVVLLAQVVRRSREQAVRLRQLAAELLDSRAEAVELAAAAERLRIAREMHDVLAHSVSVMVLQTGAARMALRDGEPRVRELLGGVENVGREALEELRVILGLLRDVVAPLPSGLITGETPLDRLVETMRAAGLPLTVRGDSQLEAVPHALRQTAFRVVQEGLTNALKHADAAPTTVEISLDARAMVVQVSDEGGPVPGPALPSGGHGLVGVRERVHDVGGVVSCGPTPGGGWQLRAVLPLPGGVVPPAVVVADVIS